MNNQPSMCLMILVGLVLLWCVSGGNLTEHMVSPCQQLQQESVSIEKKINVITSTRNENIRNAKDIEDQIKSNTKELNNAKEDININNNDLNEYKSQLNNINENLSDCKRKLLVENEAENAISNTPPPIEQQNELSFMNGIKDDLHTLKNEVGDNITSFFY